MRFKKGRRREDFSYRLGDGRKTAENPVSARRYRVPGIRLTVIRSRAPRRGTCVSEPKVLLNYWTPVEKCMPRAGRPVCCFPVRFQPRRSVHVYIRQ